jgi:hypothetical protein
VVSPGHPTTEPVRRPNLNYRLRIVQVIRGRVQPGQIVTIGPASAPPTPSPYPDCGLSLPASTRVLVALSSARNLDALTSWAWWEEDGALVTASAVESTPGSLADLVRRFERAADPPPPTRRMSGRRLATRVEVAGTVGCLWIRSDFVCVQQASRDARTDRSRPPLAAAGFAMTRGASRRFRTGLSLSGCSRPRHLVVSTLQVVSG